MIRPDLANAVKAGWAYATDADLSAPPDCISIVCDEAAQRYTRTDRQRAFAQAAIAAVTHRN